MNESKQKRTPAQSLWGIANEITEQMEAGRTPDADQLAAITVALGVLATDVEKLAADRDAKDARLKAVLALCSRAEREGVASGGSFTVAAVRGAAQQP
jgi:hypothetical protein